MFWVYILLQQSSIRDKVKKLTLRQFSPDARNANIQLMTEYDNMQSLLQLGRWAQIPIRQGCPMLLSLRDILH